MDDHFEALEMRAGKIFDRAVALGAGVGCTELFGLGPGAEVSFGFLDGVGGVELMIFGLRALQKVELDIALQLGEARLATTPDRFELFLVARHDTKTVHRNKHLVQSLLSCSPSVRNAGSIAL